MHKLWAIMKAYITRVCIPKHLVSLEQQSLDDIKRLFKDHSAVLNKSSQVKVCFIVNLTN